MPLINELNERHNPVFLGEFNEIVYLKVILLYLDLGIVATLAH